MVSTALPILETLFEILCAAYDSKYERKLKKKNVFKNIWKKKK